MPGGGLSPEFDFDEDKPAGTTYGYDADNWIRSNQYHIDNCIAIEHYSMTNDPDASEDDFGRHDFITLKEQASKPDLSGSTNRHGIYAKSDGVYIESDDETETCIFQTSNHQLINDGIPSGEIILFEKDTAVTGYTLQTDVDDKLVFISKGSGAGGETGAGDHSTGTWTISGISQAAHTHTGPSHNHQWYNSTGITGDDQSYASNGAATDLVKTTTNKGGDYVVIEAESAGGGGGSVDSIQDLYTANAGTGNTGSATPAISSAGTWRPAARVFTRQQRN